MATRFGNRGLSRRTNRQPIGVTSRFSVKELKDPTETRDSKITSKTIEWYGIPEQFEVKYEDRKESVKVSRDQMIYSFFVHLRNSDIIGENELRDKFGQNTITYDSSLPYSFRAKDFMSKLASKDLQKNFINYINNPIYKGQRGITVSHTTRMFFAQADDENWNRTYKNTGGKYDEFIGEQFTMSQADDPILSGSRMKYIEGIDDALTIVKRNKDESKVDIRNALTLAIDQEPPNYAKKEGMLLVYNKLKAVDQFYSWDYYKDVKASVDEELGGSHKDPIEFVVIR